MRELFKTGTSTSLSKQFFQNRYQYQFKFENARIIEKQLPVPVLESNNYSKQVGRSGHGMGRF